MSHFQNISGVRLFDLTFLASKIIDMVSIRHTSVVSDAQNKIAYRYPIYLLNLKFLLKDLLTTSSWPFLYTVLYNVFIHRYTPIYIFIPQVACCCSRFGAIARHRHPRHHIKELQQATSGKLICSFICCCPRIINNNK